MPTYVHTKLPAKKTGGCQGQRKTTSMISCPPDLRFISIQPLAQLILG
jgi:hypothetical protein